MNLLESMQVYVLIVDKGSLSAAAAAMDISATMAGKHLRALEARLGMQLLSRTTRRQHMTPFGEDYYARCKEILRLVEETDAQAQHQQLSPAGTLRISAPVIFGTHALVPALAEYMARHPDVRVEATLTDRVVDLAEEGFEAALRIGTLADSSDCSQCHGRVKRSMRAWASVTDTRSCGWSRAAVRAVWLRGCSCQRRCSRLRRARTR